MILNFLMVCVKISHEFTNFLILSNFKWNCTNRIRIEYHAVINCQVKNKFSEKFV